MPETRILIVDDEEDFLELLGMRLSEWGYKVIKAVNGRQAMAVVKSDKPDIVVLDYKLPDMDGVAVLKEMRKTSRTIPVIMFTAYPNAEAMKDAERLGISAFIPKMSAYNESIPSLRSAINIIEKKIS